MENAYEYRLPGRRPLVGIGLAFTAGLLVVAWTNDAPWYIWTIWGLCGAALLWAYLANPIHGVRIDGATLTWFTHRGEVPVPLSSIVAVSLKTWTDGPDDCKLRLRDGSEIDVPSLCLPPSDTLATVLSQRGVPVVRG